MIAHCPSAERRIRQEFGTEKPVTIIPHGNFIGYYPDEISKEEARKKLNLSKDNFVYLYFGLIKGYKGIEELMEVFHKIRHPGDILIVAGKPVDRVVCRMIRKKADSQCLLNLSNILDEEVQFYFRACDVVVLPYKDIMTSGNLLLSMSFARPVIIPAVGCVP